MRTGAASEPSFSNTRPATALWTSRAVTPGCASDPAAISLSERISLLRIAHSIPPPPGASASLGEISRGAVARPRSFAPGRRPGPRRHSARRPKGDHVVVPDGDEGRRGADALGERGIYPTMNDAAGLEMARLDGDSRAG